MPVLECVRVRGSGVSDFRLARALRLEVIVGGLGGLVVVDVVAGGDRLAAFGGRWFGGGKAILVVPSVVRHVVQLQ